MALGNGILYFTIPAAGAKNLEKLIQQKGASTQDLLMALGALASVVYTTFTYYGLNGLTLRIHSKSMALFLLLAPLSGAPFYTAGHEGALALNFSENIANAIGAVLFVFRTLSYIDGVIKFPERIAAVQQAGQQALTQRDVKEILRLLNVVLISFVYAAAMTDAIYAAVQAPATWFNLSASVSKSLGYTGGTLGAITSFPLFLYWVHRGVLQLTGGGKAADPTDRYTLLCLLFVIPSVLGALGGVTNSTGQMFGQLGMPALVSRVISATGYALCAGTPGMALFLRRLLAAATPQPVHAAEAREPTTHEEGNTLPEPLGTQAIAISAAESSVPVPRSPASAHRTSPRRFFDRDAALEMEPVFRVAAQY